MTTKDRAVLNKHNRMQALYDKAVGTPDLENTAVVQITLLPDSGKYAISTRGGISPEAINFGLDIAKDNNIKTAILNRNQ